MPGFFASTVKGVSETWHKLGKTARVVVISAASLAFLALFVVAFSTSRGPTYEILWSNLNLQDAGTIVKELEKDGVPYQLTDGGRTVKVPKESLYKTRLALASQGIPSSGIVGFEALTQSSIWATDFDRKVQYVRALSGELARTIKEIQGVEDCRVHIVLPEPSVFTQSQKPPTAAVLVKTSPFNQLNSLMVRGIVNLVARSVEGLVPENVTVLDSEGRLLSQDAIYGQDSATALSGTLLELTAKTERELEKRLTAFLTPVLGTGNVVCQVRAEINMDQIKTTDTKYSTEPQGIVRSTQETQEQYRGEGSPPGGQAGGLDIPSYASPGTGQSQYQRTDVTRNYEVNKTVTETLVSPGSIKRLSVSVVVNKELDEGQKDVIREAVSTALGLDTKRQDQISVTGILFDTSLAKNIQDALAPKAEKFPRVYVYAMAGAAAIILGTIILLLMRKRRSATSEAEEVSLLPSPEEAAPSVSPELLARQRARENVERVCRTNPQLTANLIKSWLLEDQQ